ncbi:MAG TPA: hypothetical protein VEL73_00275, partial [Mycobacteriales bacterium]|nr:hypothetical protein [Mycobacteriales bacterium]
VAAADGRPWRPVIRVTERDGDVETAVVAAGSAAHHAALAADDRHAGEPWTGEDRADGLRIVPQPEPASGRPTPAGGMVTLPADTSEVVARLAQLLREDPTLASSWGREAQES